jgi:hypothetical protein
LQKGNAENVDVADVNVAGVKIAEVNPVACLERLSVERKPFRVPKGGGAGRVPHHLDVTAILS